MVYLLTEDVLKNSKNGETGPSNHSTDNTTGRSAIFGSSVLSKGLWHMSNVYIPPSLSSSSLSTLLCSAPCLLSACLGDSLVTGSDGRGAGVSSSPQQAGLTALRSVSCVVPPVSSCPLTVRDWEIESRVTVCVTQPAQQRPEAASDSNASSSLPWH